MGVNPMKIEKTIGNGRAKMGFVQIRKLQTEISL
jgi:hypothetical protein